MHDSRLSVLIADSKVLIALDLERILMESHGCEVTIAPLATLETHLQSGAYDIVMLDAVMSEQVNMDHAAAVKESGAQLVFLSSFDDFREAFPALAHFNVLVKPYDPGEVADVVRRLSRVGS